MKTYIITTGSYSGYRIITSVRGPNRPALSTLYKQFRELYDIPEPLNKPMTEYTEIWARVIKHTAAESKIYKEYDGKSIAEAFVEWLTTEHKYEEVKTNEFYVE